ncbi:hypothetical protein HRG_006852 [Hirsutella rhossiliensis]|uniref:Uncharacterized protein n=1 Tax=Hirsutella rhossiliensis TaxID=111463 RepID=A0A9P8MUR6_9HYPO|nr:uncharacterized protein HRG_06852 [Hirsutella rhossiliensis]KAH0961772.1 hypothetical protein HRG_06852 [Hirsutella rhossiliensis]
MVTSNYVIEISETAIIVSIWDEFHVEAAKFSGEMVLAKYGGFVIEIGGDIKLATDDNMTREVAQNFEPLPPLSDDEEVLGERTPQPNSRSLEKRMCSHPGFFDSSICPTYTDYHACTGATHNKRRRRI